MTHFPRKSSRFAQGAPAVASARPAVARDGWGRPIFQAPTLNPRALFEALPFTATRVTHTSRRRRS